MNQIVTTGIVLTRTNYGEADKIVTLLTPDYGKVRLMAKGVRKPKSKLAGGVELFCVSQLGYITGRTDLSTLTSARIERQFEHIAKDIDRTMFGYEAIKCVSRITEDEAGKDYYELLKATLAALDDLRIPLPIASMWFDLNILNLTGHQPNLHTDLQGNKLTAEQTYIFSYDDMGFAPSPAGHYDAQIIKLLRLAIATDDPRILAKVSGVGGLLPEAKNLADTMRKQTLGV